MQGSENVIQPKVTELIRFSMEKRVPATVISENALDKVMEDTITKYRTGKYLLPSW